MSSFLQTLFPLLSVGMFYRRVHFISASPLEESGPILFAALHRNGAVDGFVYGVTLQFPTFMVASQLRKSLLGRLFFFGIEVVRPQDRSRETDASAVNRQALEQCLATLEQGGRLALFPEGTSDLGHRHLPFQSGTARLLAQAWEKDIPVTLIPLGIHYEFPWGVGSSVEVVAGEPISRPEGFLDLAPPLRVRLCKTVIAQGLETVGVDYADAQVQEQVEQAAFLATLDRDEHRFPLLKRWANGLPPSVVTARRTLEEALENQPHLHYRGVPLFPQQGMRHCILSWLIVAPWSLLALVFNVPPVLLAYWAGRRFADGRNVIALWRILVGVPVLSLWMAGCIAAYLVLDHPLLAVVHPLVTWIGLKSWSFALRRGVALYNGWRCPQGRKLFHDMLQALRSPDSLSEVSSCESAVCTTQGDRT